MAANNEIQTSRITVATSGSLVDDAYRNVEAALRTIMGVTADSDVSECAQIGSGPDMVMTGTLTLAANGTADLHAAPKQQVDAYSGIMSSIRCTAKIDAAQTITTGSSDALEFGSAPIETGGDCWAIGDPTRLVAPEDGDYIFCGVIRGGPAAANPDFTLAVKKNGTTTLYSNIGLGHNHQAGGDDASISFGIMANLSSSDYLEFIVTTVGANHDIETDTYISMFKVG